MIEVIFWLFILLVIYIYIGYPIIIKLLSNYFSFTVKKNNFFPEVVLLISAYNEEEVIEEKIINSLNLDYPKNKLNIIVISDGSTDNTDQIVKQYVDQGIKLERIEGRVGKNECLNEVIKKIEERILVFSDANSMYEKDALKKLVSNFKDERVGGVVGKLKYKNKSNVSNEEGLYWQYEDKLKTLESKMGSLLIGNGSIIAARKELVNSFFGDVANDFQLTIECLGNNYKVIYEKKAIATEKISASSNEEYSRKVRIITRGLTGTLKLWHKINGVVKFEFISHKLLRWFVGIYQIGLFICNLFLLEIPLYRFILGGQVLFYNFSILGFIFEKNGIKNKLFNIPFYFNMVNLAGIHALINILRGKKKITWDKAKSTRKR